ncbi:transient receptor potential cation channel subfamily A member 1-like [Xenia sp. Carnegie-2017]|uniref:transient receptor potential cation channel subfamily A member 1-like n=1 Tax=Xenia sp. Carnegie-2017 TaxID=2897299 RepID=UPI001F03B564|nr:transient receptor potential cation channel subfamily A member 1-like [Xenia sp. Carnegie-2017]
MTFVIVSDVDENGSKVENSLADQMKLAAIYDDQRMINNILREKRSDREIQRLLSKTDERGQPCIFYALESRSLNSLTSLLNHVKDTKCVIAKNGESVLHVATRMGDVDFLRNLLQHDFIVDLVNHVEGVSRRSPLHFAATFNHVEIAKVLLEHGGKITEVDITDKCPLYIAANKGHANMLELFLKHEKRRVQELLFSERYGGKYYRNILHVAVDSGDERTVQVCLQDENVIREDLCEEIRHGDGYLIHAACKKGMEKSLFRFMDVMRHLDLLQLNRKDKQGFTPIHKAAINNHSDENSQSALVLAAERGHVRVVEELLKLKADFTIRDDSNRTVLHYAIAYPETLRILLKKKDLVPLLINEKEIDGYTPIHNAALKGFLESVRILLEYNADLNVFTNTSRSPLHCAVSSQNSDVVELILANEPALINKVDATGKTPLHTAANFSSPEVVKCLLNNGAIILRDGNMFSPLHIAAFKGHLNIVELLVMFKPSMIDWENKYKRTALLTAAVKGKADVVKYLLDSMAKITKIMKLPNASINVKVAMIICLISAGVQTLKEICQLFVYKFNYFMDKVNYLECVLYVSTFIFAVPSNDSMSVKTSFQWMACSVALFCAWINLIMYLRRFASYGIIILMMRKISFTLIKVMGLLIFFLVAFAAAFTVIMNDRQGFEKFSVSILTGATMTMGEFDFKQTFLGDHSDYNTFYLLQLVLLVGFLVIMPIIIMNLLLALAIDDTSSIMQHAKLQKHIQTAKMIIDIERKRSSFPWRNKKTLIPCLQERPNKTYNFTRPVWDFIFYGPDFSTNVVDESRDMSTLIEMVKELQNKMLEIQNEFTMGQDKQNAMALFRGYSERIETFNPEETRAESKLKAWGRVQNDHEKFSVPSSSYYGFGDDLKYSEGDFDEEREARENDPELNELKRQHSQMDTYEDKDGVVAHDDVTISVNENEAEDSSLFNNNDKLSMILRTDSSVV